MYIWYHWEGSQKESEWELSKTTKVGKRKVKKCEVALTLTAATEWETQKNVELGIL